MNPTKIEWTDLSWNPMTGCLHGCEYCYAEKIAERWRWDGADIPEVAETHIAGPGDVFPFGFEPTFYPHRLKEPLQRKRAAKIFTVDMGDLFGGFVPAEWIEQVIEVIKQAPQHTFQLLTKNPARMAKFSFPSNVWLGTTVTDEKSAYRLDVLREADNVTFASFEPLLGHVDASLDGIDWIIIGAQTNPNKQPQEGWVSDILARATVPVFMKDNLTWSFHRHEFPQPRLELVG
jgi:protein gp37